MNLLKHLALSSYYYASLPSRRRMATLRAVQHAAPVMVLFYHRVADLCPNDWTISTARFARQLEWIERHFDLVSLSEAQRRIRVGSDRPAVSITFDDGYAENCTFALPLLVERKIPVTYFVAAEHVLAGTPFPHDIAAGMPLRPNTIAELQAVVGGGHRDRRSYPYARRSGSDCRRAQTVRRGRGRAARPGAGDRVPDSLLRIPVWPAREHDCASNCAGAKSAMPGSALRTVATIFPATMHFTCSGSTATLT